MSDTTRDLVQRLETLERENRRMKRIGGAVAATLGAAALVSFAAPRICDTVYAERFVVHDSNNKQRMVLNAYGTRTPGIQFNDAKGKGVAALQVDSSGEMSLEVFKRNDHGAATFRFTPDNLNALGSACDGHVKADEDKAIN